MPGLSSADRRFARERGVECGNELNVHSSGLRSIDGGRAKASRWICFDRLFGEIVVQKSGTKDKPPRGGGFDCAWCHSNRSFRERPNSAGTQFFTLSREPDARASSYTAELSVDFGDWSPLEFDGFSEKRKLIAWARANDQLALIVGRISF